LDEGEEMKMIVTLAALLISSPAAAAPVYLTCPIVEKDGTRTVDITLNEEQGTATVLMREAGWGGSMSADFSPSIVKFTHRILRNVFYVYAIDRVDLHIVRALGGGGATTFGQGVCTIAETPKRAF
jgi:hypothetical protein